MPTTVDHFLKTILRSGLLDREQLQETLRAAPAESRDDAEKIANYLVKYGKLSRYQAKKLLQGVSAGLMLGPYEIQAPIGKGGMGSVYLALDTRTRTHLALKVLPPKRARGEERHLARFRREMELSQCVRHPHLALTYEVGTVHHINYIAMEYIPGQTLQRLARDAPLPAPRAARLMAEVASALDYAHNMCVIHRDLKPSNIMVTPNDHAKVLDLGLAMIEGEVIEDSSILGGEGYLVGSIDYMAPEQTYDSAKVDGRADIYAVGCILYYALVGQAPFPGGNLKEKIKRHRREPPPLVHEKNPAVPEAFSRFIARLMAKRPEERPMTASAVRQELLNWAGETPQPVEQSGDSTFQKAVATLHDADVPSDVLAEALPEDPDPDSAATSTRLLDRLLAHFARLPDLRKEHAWIIVCLSVAWSVLLLVLLLLVLMRQGP
jgi:serine/threonine protein kinase